MYRSLPKDHLHPCAAIYTAQIWYIAAVVILQVSRLRSVEFVFDINSPASPSHIIAGARA